MEKADSLIKCLISSFAKFSGDIKTSIPIELKSIEFEFSRNSTLEILAIVRFAPSCFDKKQVVKLVDSELVSETTKSEFSTSAFFRTEMEVESPSIVLISSLFSAILILDSLLSIKVIS